MLKKLIPIIPIGLSIFVVTLVLICAVFVKPEPVVPVNPPVVNNDVTPTPPIPTPPIPTPPVVPFVEDDDLPEVDTSDWEVYTNKEYGFEFKYPEIFKLTDPYEGIYKPTNSKRIAEISFCLNCSISFDNGMYLSILYSDDQSKYPDLPKGKYVYRDFEGTKNQRIDSSTGRITGDTLILYLKTSDGFYTFRWEAEDLESRGFSYKNYLIPMLSTFKFIE